MQIDSLTPTYMQLAPFSELMRRAHHADELFRKGELLQAHAAYLELLKWRIHSLKDDAPLIEQVTVADIKVIRKLAHLTVLVGNHVSADDLIHALQLLYKGNGLVAEADKLLLARAYLAIEFAALHKADKLLEELAPRVDFGKAQTLSSEDLSLWEKRHCWLGVTASTKRDLLATLYLVKGRIFASNGGYEKAIALYDQAQKHIEANPKENPSHTWFALHTAKAEASLNSANWMMYNIGLTYSTNTLTFTPSQAFTSER